MKTLKATSNLLTLLVLLVCAITLRAQSPGTPGPALITPAQTSTPSDSPLDPKLPTLFVVGDSTARNGADLGWGDHLAQHFDTSRLNIANRARAGRSSRSFYNEGLWDHVLSELKPGDFVLIQMGHNDGGTTTPQTDAKARNSYKGIGEETAAYTLPKPFTTGPLAGQSTETIHTYGWYLRKYIADTRAKGATPILLTPTIRNIWTKPTPTPTQALTPDDSANKPQIERDMGFHTYLEKIAFAEHVLLADMATVAANGFQALGPERTAAYFPIDHTHTSAAGADLNAQSVVTALRNANLPLITYLKPPQ